VARVVGEPMTTPDGDVLEVALPSHPKYLPLVRALVEESAEVAGFPAEERQRIALGVTEGITNVMRHGYGGCTDRRIDLVVHTPNGLFRIDIHDYGCFVDPEAIRSRPLETVRPGGLGVHLMKATMDTVTYQPNEHGGTTLTLIKRLDEEGS
jgi:anti-sigma regulatory factor (Ser/Thr protein kinase)